MRTLSSNPLIEQKTTKFENSSISSSMRKIEIEQQTTKFENSSPKIEKNSGSTVENGGGVPQIPENPLLETTATTTTNSSIVESESKDVAGNKEETSSSSKKECPAVRSADDGVHHHHRGDSTATKAKSSMIENASHREKNFQMDPMAPPPLSKSSPERDVKIDFVQSDPKPMVSNVDTELRPTSKEEEKTTKIGKTDSVVPEEERLKLNVAAFPEENGKKSSSSPLAKSIDLQLDMEKPDREHLVSASASSSAPASAPAPAPSTVASNSKSHQTLKNSKMPEPRTEKSDAGGPGVLPLLGHNAPSGGVVSTDGGAVSSASIQSRATFFRNIKEIVASFFLKIKNFHICMRVTRVINESVVDLLLIPVQRWKPMAKRRWREIPRGHYMIINFGDYTTYSPEVNTYMHVYPKIDNNFRRIEVGQSIDYPIGKGRRASYIFTSDQIREFSTIKLYVDNQNVVYHEYVSRADLPGGFRCCFSERFNEARRVPAAAQPELANDTSLRRFTREERREETLQIIPAGGDTSSSSSGVTLEMMWDKLVQMQGQLDRFIDQTSQMPINLNTRENAVFTQVKSAEIGHVASSSNANPNEVSTQESITKIEDKVIKIADKEYPGRVREKGQGPPSSSFGASSSSRAKANYNLELTKMQHKLKKTNEKLKKLSEMVMSAFPQLHVPREMLEEDDDSTSNEGGGSPSVQGGGHMSQNEGT